MAAALRHVTTGGSWAGRTPGPPTLCSATSWESGMTSALSACAGSTSTLTISKQKEAPGPMCDSPARNQQSQHGVGKPVPAFLLRCRPCVSNQGPARQSERRTKSLLPTPSFAHRQLRDPSTQPAGCQN